MRAWKPLHMPRIRPSRRSRRSAIFSDTAGFLNVVAMNLPEPSGSSPPEKPPGKVGSLYCLDYCRHALFNVLRGAVAYNEYLCFSARKPELALCIQFTVGAGERGYEYSRLCSFYGNAAVLALACIVAVGYVALGGSSCGEHAVEP